MRGGVPGGSMGNRSAEVVPAGISQQDSLAVVAVSGNEGALALCTHVGRRLRSLPIGVHGLRSRFVSGACELTLSLFTALPWIWKIRLSAIL